MRVSKTGPSVQTRAYRSRPRTRTAQPMQAPTAHPIVLLERSVGDDPTLGCKPVPGGEHRLRAAEIQ